MEIIYFSNFILENPQTKTFKTARFAPIPLIKFLFSDLSSTDSCHPLKCIPHPFLSLQDGFRTPLHEFEDRSIRVVLDHDTYLYGVFDGHEGSLASDFASQRMPAEILLGQLQGKTDDEDVKAVLHQVWRAIMCT